MKNLILSLLISLTCLSLLAQTDPFNISIEPISISELGGLQSFAFGQANGKWLLIGGRLDGLHRRQPWASFDLAGHNNQLIVVDPTELQTWSAPLTSLPISIQEQLSSTNMNFIQEGETLYFFGGYGYSETEGDHTTFPNLTAIQLPEVIDAIIANTSFIEYFRQISDTEFQVTGGKLKKINNVYHLLGGQKFIGRYNPMGPDHGPGFIQEYTNQIRRFTISDDGTNIEIEHLTAFTDELNLHRRDYNAEPQILPDGSEGITMFSGVFQQTIDLPFLNSVTVDNTAYQVDDSFQQYYNHYHCAVVPLYSASQNEMHTVFFGGIAQFYDSLGIMVQDNDVPFVKTIARVTRDANGTMSEYKLPIEMPSYLGAGSEFIINKDLNQYSNGVLKLDDLNSDTTLIGYIFGGINSTDSNIFWVNDGTQSAANSQIFRVFLTRYQTTANHNLNEQSKGSLNMIVYPNPNDGLLQVEFNLKDINEEVRLKVIDGNGKVLEDQVLSKKSIGKNKIEKSIRRISKSRVIYVTLETSDESATRKIILN